MVSFMIISVLGSMWGSNFIDEKSLNGFACRAAFVVPCRSCPLEDSSQVGCSSCFHVMLGPYRWFPLLWRWLCDYS